MKDFAKAYKATQRKPQTGLTTSSLVEQLRAKRMQARPPEPDPITEEDELDLDLYEFDEEENSPLPDEVEIEEPQPPTRGERLTALLTKISKAR